MVQQRTAYELSQSQVSTPSCVIKHFWELVHERRPNLGTILDLGAGDCRFAIGSKANNYVGIEIDPVRARTARIPEKGKLITGCAFAHRPNGYDACVGNPPYVRHHDLEAPWRDRVAKRIQDKLGIRLNQKSNLFLYFLCLGLLKSKDDGLVALVIPFEWVSRPSAAPLRAYLRSMKWKVDVYRYQGRIFDKVLTTACITIIDKNAASSNWSYYSISPSQPTVTCKKTSDVSKSVLKYSQRGGVWAMRGMSPGSQKVFCLTEGERIHNGLHKSDVVPCVRSLRPLPKEVRKLTVAAFQKHYVAAGERCWLVKSYGKLINDRVRSYLDGVPEHVRNNFTCSNREAWFRFPLHPIPNLLVASGFTSFGPKIVINAIDAHAVGAVVGIHDVKTTQLPRLQEHLLKINFEKRIVAHAKTLRKVEIGQLNTALIDFEGKG